uniref:Putative ubiquitin protein ligase n=1 Tax=Ixodes ricinus TaxID=34613 RepID=V5H365_IXORI
MTLRTVLLSLQALLAAAEPDDPQDAVVARQFKENPEMFKLTAQHWAQVYAGGPKHFPEFDAKIKRLLDMGVEEHRARVALSSYSMGPREGYRSHLQLGLDERKKRRKETYLDCLLRLSLLFNLMQPSGTLFQPSFQITSPRRKVPPVPVRRAETIC